MKKLPLNHHAKLLIASLILGLIIFHWGRGWVRNYLGDIVVIIFLYSLLSLFTTISSKRKAIIVFIFAVTIELFQLLNFSTGITYIDNLVFGSTFDLLDIVAYAIGAAIIILLHL